MTYKVLVYSSDDLNGSVFKGADPQMMFQCYTVFSSIHPFVLLTEQRALQCCQSGVVYNQALIFCLKVLPAAVH